MKIAFFHGYNFTEPALYVENYLYQKTKAILQVHPIILYVSNTLPSYHILLILI